MPEKNEIPDEKLPEIVRPGSTLASRKAARLKRVSGAKAEDKSVKPSSGLITSEKLKGK